MPLATSASSISCSRCSSANCRGDRLTAIDTGRNPRRCQAMFCAQASFSTQRPIGTISPVSSASGMNCIGGSTPSSGWVQRNSASTPVICPRRQIHLRLVMQRELIALEGVAQRGFQRQTLDRLDLDLLGEEAEVVLAVFLGEIHRHVGILGQRLHVGAIGGIHGDADAGRGVALVAAQLHGLAENRQQLAGDAFDVVAFRRSSRE